MKKKEIILPKLPRGMGSYMWNDSKHTLIKYRKPVRYKDEKKIITVYGKTIAEVNNNMKIKEEEFKKNIELQITNIVTGTLEEGMNTWLQLYKTEELKSKSYDRVESTYLTHIVGSDLGRMQEQAITSDHIQTHMKNLKNTKTGEKLSYSSQKKVYELLNQYFRYKFVKQPYMNPMVSVSKPKNDGMTDKLTNEELIIWNDDEMYKLSKVAAMPYRNGTDGFKHGLAIIFIMWSFLRIGEATALQWKDIDFEEETVNVYKQFSRVKDRKSASQRYTRILTNVKYYSVRKYKLNKMAIDAIKEYKKRKSVVNDDDYIFDNGAGDNSVLSGSSITTTYNLMVRRAELDENKHVTIHGLRHSGISYMLRHGVPIEVISKQAGHRTIQVTLETYYSVIEQQKTEAIDILNSKHYVNFLE